MTNTLDSDRSLAPRPMVALHYVALLCGVGPMAIGAFVFVIFLITRSPGAAIFGFMTIVAGCAAAVLGAVCLGVYWFQAARATPDDATVARRHAKRDAAILLANFPLAIVFSLIGLKILNADSQSVNVVVHNEDAVTADSVILDTGDHAARQLGPIAPGKSAEARVKFGPRGLTVLLLRAGRSTSYPIFDHMDGDTVSSHEDLLLVIRDGKVVLKE